MAINKSNNYIKLLSDFWSVFYGNHEVLNSSLGAMAEMVKSHYFAVLQRALPLSLANRPVFQESFWNLLQLEVEEAKIVQINNETYIRYPLDQNYAHAPLLYNVVYTPTLTYKEGTDYVFSRDSETGLSGNEAILGYNSFINFKPASDPFLNPLVARRRLSNGNVGLSLFSPKSYIDDQTLYTEFGAVLGVAAPNSPEYQNFLEGLLRLYVKGPSISNLNAGINLAAGYPISREDDTIVEVINADEYFEIVTAKNHSYIIDKIPITEIVNNVPVAKVFPLLKLSIPSGIDFSDPSIPLGSYPMTLGIKRNSTFIDNLKIVDNTSEPNWWRQQNGILSSQLSPGLPVVDASDPFVVDELFQRYFKYNTFGVFVDYRVVRREFQVLGDFFKILDKVKPTYKSYVIQANQANVYVTIVSEGVDGLPSFERAFNISSVVEMIPEIGMDMVGNIYGDLEESQIGDALEQFGFSYDQVQFQITDSSPSSTYEIYDYDLEIGAEMELGADKGLTLSYPMFVCGLLVPDTEFGIGSTGSVQIAPRDFVVPSSTVWLFYLSEGSGNVATNFGNDPDVSGIITAPSWIPHYSKSWLGGLSFSGLSSIVANHSTILSTSAGFYMGLVTELTSSPISNILLLDTGFAKLWLRPDLSLRIDLVEDITLLEASYETAAASYSLGSPIHIEASFDTSAISLHLNNTAQSLSLVAGSALTESSIGNLRNYTGLSSIGFGLVGDIYLPYIGSGLRNPADRTAFYTDLVV